MKGKHIAIFNVPGPVHINPTLSLVAVLIRRGYRVTYVTSGRFSSAISELGAEVLLCPRYEFPHNQKDQGDRTPVDRQYCSTLDDLASRTIALVSDFYASNVPNLILYDTYAFAGLILSEKLRVPAIRTTTHLAYDRENLTHDNVPPAFSALMISLSARFDTLFHSFGIQRKDVIFDRSPHTICFYVVDMQLSQQRSDPNSFYAPRCAAERPFGAPWKSDAAGKKPKVLVSASTTYDQGLSYYELCVEAVSKCGGQAIVSIGPNNSVQQFESLPSRCEISQGVPQVAIMPSMDLMICLGGMATTMEAMYHGLPMIMLTHGYSEAELYAERVQSHQLGLHLKGTKVSAEELKVSIERVMRDSELRSAVKRMQRIVRRGAGGEDVANWIEDYLEAYVHRFSLLARL